MQQWGSQNACYGQHIHQRNTCIQQGPRCLFYSGPGSVDIVEQQDSAASQTSALNLEGPPYIFSPGGRSKAGLRGKASDAAQGAVIHGYAEPGSQACSNKPCLIEAALTEAPGMKRHRHQPVVQGRDHIIREMGGHEIGEREGARFTPAIL